MDKYRAAIIEYRAANLSVKEITKKIGENLSSCGDLSEDGKSPHLKEAYRWEAYRRESDGCFYERHPAYDDPAEEYLKDACPHCYAAHNLIQERKDARQRFGVAKRRLMAMAKALEGAGND